MNSAAVRDRFETVGNQEILVADWRGSSPKDVRASMAAVLKLLSTRREKVFVLFQVEGMHWDAKLPFEGVAWMKDVAPRTSRVAISGAAGLQLTVIAGMRSLTKMPLPVFATRDEAIAWLTRPRRKTA